MNTYGYTLEQWQSMSFCERTIAEYKYNKSIGSNISDELYESYMYALNVLSSEDAERRYLNGD